MEYGAFSHRGLQRKSNEDHFYIPEDSQRRPAFIIVADGMGGHNAGDLASRLAVENIVSYFLEMENKLQSAEVLIKAIQHSMELANDKIYALSRSEAHLSGIGTTLTMAVFDENRLYVAHVGDSRCYLIRKKRVYQITKDHSLVQELLDNGSITHDEMHLHPKKNVITRALGTEGRLRIDCFEKNLETGDMVLLCTDGLINYIDLEEHIKDMPQNISMEQLADRLGRAALEAGGSDDITVAVARYSGMGKRGDVLAG